MLVDIDTDIYDMIVPRGTVKPINQMENENTDVDYKLLGGPL